MARRMNSVDDFLGHKTSNRSGGSLDKWRKEGKLIVWLHTGLLPTAVWQHGGIPRLVITKDEDDKPQRKFFGGKWNCPESEDFLKGQYKRNDDGTREEDEPAHCGLCRFEEWLYQEVVAGRIKWTDQAFRFDATDPKDTVILHAGGLLNMYSEREMAAEKKKELKKAGISPADAWSENMFAKCNYVFAVVANNAVSKGVQIATEAGLLGDRVKDVIADARESLGDEEGNPFLHPFAIQWEYRKGERIDKLYYARRIEKEKLTPQIEALIRGKAPNLSNIVAPFDQKTMRAQLERYCLLKGVPWDDIFDVKPVPKGEEPDEPEEEEEEGESDNDGASGDGASDGDGGSGNAEDADENKEDDDGMVACDACEKPMAADAEECPHCGQKYEVEGETKPEPPPPPKQIKKRSEMKGKAEDPKAAKKKAKGDKVPF
jgi:hypothetical protein